MRKIYLDIQEFMVLFIVENFVAKYLPAYLLTWHIVKNSN